MIMTSTGIWIGPLDLPWHGLLQRHVVLDSARRTDYPDEVDGRRVGGHWAYAQCGDPAYESDVVAAARRLPECPGCWPRPTTSTQAQQEQRHAHIRH